MATVKSTDETFDTLVKENKIIIFDFWASWCGPCIQIAPILEEISEEMHAELMYTVRNSPTKLNGFDSKYNISDENKSRLDMIANMQKYVSPRPSLSPNEIGVMQTIKVCNSGVGADVKVPEIERMRSRNISEIFDESFGDLDGEELLVTDERPEKDINTQLEW